MIAAANFSEKRKLNATKGINGELRIRSNSEGA